eukprot:TRINITY_DN5882_c0_g1_i3.p2 TRINITY_DN5882_c0_g1~~TRINITY_DN5882_c0_g1_i3.p2  ORF type:complete len:155 (-),score=37.73 TRINITY_DN5882_c0_g1_i3:478-891(-)
MVRNSGACAGLAALALAPQASAFVANPGAAPAKAPALRASLAAQSAPRAASEPGATYGFAAAAAGLGFAAAVVRGTRKQAASRAAASLVSLRAVEVGDSIPNVGLDKGFPPDKVMLGDYCKGKKVVLVGLPGAFTPT